MDPAGPLFYLSSTDDKLDKSDAQFVEVIHSCSGILGYPFSLGHADYWPNGGFPVQPGCGLDVTGKNISFLLSLLLKVSCSLIFCAM